MLWQHLYPICIRFFEYTAWNLFRGFLVSLAFTQPGVDTVQDFFVQLNMKTTYETAYAINGKKPHIFFSISGHCQTSQNC